MDCGQVKNEKTKANYHFRGMDEKSLFLISFYPQKPVLYGGGVIPLSLRYTTICPR